MNVSEMKKWRLFRVVCALCMLMIVTSLSFGQSQSQSSSAQITRNRSTKVQSIPNGAKMKFKGVVISRDSDTFTIRDRNRTDYQVLLTDDTSIKTYGGFLRGGKKYAVTDILRGLIVEVEGRGDSQGQLVADKIRFNESDMRSVLTSDVRVTPVEENQKRISGQMYDLYAIAQEAREQVTAVNERV